MPGLDGLRALAVAAVIAYHLGLSWAPGGLLGVGVFFTLSGYLITDLLLGSWESLGRLRLRTFWVRRARRLLPALAVMLVVVSLWVGVAQPSQLGALRGDVVAATFYVSNWWLAFQHVSYFARFTAPSPLGHLWSLAVEEQFYLLWPWLLWLGLLWSRRWRQARPAPASSPGLLATRQQLWPLALVTMGLAAASAVELAVLYHPSFDPSRIYYGTDTRAFALLIGAALAMVWPSKGLQASIVRGARLLVDAMGMVGLAVIALLVALTTEYSAFLYRGGLVLLALATALVVASASHPAGRLGTVLGWRPLRWAGVRSYAIYLWHYPVIVLTTPTVVEGTDMPRVLLQVGATLALAELSWRFVESPVRSGALGRLWAQARTARQGREPLQQFLRRAPRRVAALSAVPIALVLAVLSLAGAMPAAPPGTLAAANQDPEGPGVDPPAVTTSLPPAATTTSLPPPAETSSSQRQPTSTGNPLRNGSGSTTAVQPGGAGGSGGHAGGGHAGGGHASTTGTAQPATPSSRPVASTTAPTTPSPPAGASGKGTNSKDGRLRTSCRQVVEIGDSTSESLVSAEYLPDAAQRLPAQYARVGVRQVILRIEGGTSVVETVEAGEQNAYDMALALVRAGYEGCWVVALGTNDAADVYVGSTVGMAARVKRMMSVIGHDQVMWVNVKSLLSSGPYSEANMRDWDKALLAACPAYPNMRIFDWAKLVKPSWFTPDGIHYNSPGSAPRAAAFADALATAFPAHPQRGPSRRSCVIEASPSWHLPTFRY